MASAQFRTEEMIGLGVAALLHVGLFGALLMQPDDEDIQPLPERVTVSLAEDVGLEAAAPDPVAESRLAMAPTLTDDLAPAEPDEVVAAPAPQAAPPPPRRQPRTAPRVRRTETSQAPRRRPDNSASRPKPPKKPGGASRIGSDFLPGAGSSTETTETRTVAKVFGAKEQADLRSAINRQLKPRWSAPQGADAERLVTVVSWRMNTDGSLAGRPKVVRQSGINDANRAQADIHAERAIRAVQLAAPFKLPPEFYDKWKYIRGASFDRNLSR